jgi:hypothetical protein
LMEMSGLVACLSDRSFNLTRSLAVQIPHSLSFQQQL